MSSSLPHTISFLSSVLKLDNNNNNHSNHSSPISSSSEPHNNNNNNNSQLIPTILDILAHPDEDEKPDRLKSFLSNSTHLNLLPEQQLNQLILSLLHQHREDIHHKPLPSTLSRSSSQRITIGKSRFQPRSPHPSSTPSTPDFSARFLQQQQQQPKSASVYNQPPAIHPPHSLIPLSKPIPPSLNLPPPEKLNASALEFKPILSRTVSMPFESTAINPNSSPYIPTPDSARLSTHQRPIFINSVPRSATSLIHHSPAVSPSANSPYFPRNSRPATPEIPRDPWLKEDSSSSSSFLQDSSPRLQSRLTQIEQQQLDDPENLSLFSPFQATAISPLKSPLPTLVTESPRLRKNQEPSCPSALQWGLSPEMAEEMAQFTVWDQSDSDGSQPPAIVHHPPEEDEDDPLGRYWMSPYDELCAALAGTGVSEALIDQALGQNGFDTSKAIDWLLERHGIPTQPPVSSSSSTSIGGAGGAGAGDPSLLSTVIDPSSHFRPSASSANSASSRDHSPAGKQTRSPAASRPASPRFIPANKSPSPTFQKRPFPNTSNIKAFVPSSASSVSASVSADDPAFEPGPSHRVCRFYLQGCCLRSDCKFSHDVGKAICRFWLKGHCLKGESKCDFLHEIPDLTNEEAQREEEMEKAKAKPMIIRSFADEFPSLEESVSNSNKKKSQGTPATASRLKPVLLLPDRPITPSPSLLKLSQTYHEMTLEFGSRRKECFDRAKECFKRADGAGVKKWSKEGDEWNRRLTEEPRATAGLMITERNRLMKDAVREGVSDRLAKVDEGPDRMHRGKEMGGGICLGVVSSSPASSSVKERMEVLMDLHGLHPDDGVYYLEKFMMALKTEGFQGLAYILTSSTFTSSSPSTYESSSSSSSDSSESSSTNSDGLSEEPTCSGITSKESSSNHKNNKNKLLLGPAPLNVLENLQLLEPGRALKEDLQLEKAVKTWLDRKRFSSESSTPSSNSNSKSSTLTNTPSRPGIVCISLPNLQVHIGRAYT
ncbi:hypothetical protein PGTUg99_025418 [Puccinia graminis f. sp. tritici]|uniref:C3H1-type domain-containing protein n=1 Tax=Puccinia graminis f. sp. tritici TaxID=56615 RepID=A0A5B0NFE9_PUCGR|nr:hypothetical protein PGTUg99_025418 [Puccinia graminis f. sp. tritici]